MNEDSKKYEKVLDQLGFYLRAGHEHMNWFYEQYKQVKTKPNFNEEAYFQQQVAPLNQWLNEVHHYLRQEFGINHHYVTALLQSQPLSFSRSGWPSGASNSYYGFKSHLDALLKITFRIEERLDLSIRREIAKQERDASTLYEMTYIGREIRVNDFYVSKQDFMSENEQFFSYIFERPWETIKIEDMLKDLKIKKFKKSVSQMLSDLKITGNIRKIFCPDASSKAIVFRNPISRGFADENNLPNINIGRNSKK